jgi:hypothetical protein
MTEVGDLKVFEYRCRDLLEANGSVETVIFSAALLYALWATLS